MGAFIIRCSLGFPTFRNTRAGEALERESGRMATAYCDGHNRMLRGFAKLHDAVDAALVSDVAALTRCGERGTRLLDRSADCIAQVASTLEQLRKNLAVLLREGTDPLALREPFFSAVDAGRLFAALSRDSGGASDRNAWDLLVSAVRDGGAVAGLRLLERTAWRLHTALRSQVLRTEQALGTAPHEVARQLHHAGLAGAVIADLFSTWLRQAGYFSLLCEEATRLWEAEVDREEARTA